MSLKPLGTAAGDATYKSCVKFSACPLDLSGTEATVKEGGGGGGGK